MSWKAPVAIAAAAGVVSISSALAFRAARQDRDRLLQTFAEDRLTRLGGEIHALEDDLVDIRQHIEIAARHLASADSPEGEKQQLEAVLAVVKSFEMMAIYDDAGRRRVAAIDEATPPRLGGVAFEAGLARTAKDAISRGATTVSPPIGSAEAPCYRAFAAPIRRKGRTDAVVLLVNLRRDIDRLRVSVGGASAAFVLAERDAPPLILQGWTGTARPFAERKKDLDDLLRRMRAGETGTSIVEDSGWGLLGLGTPYAVAAYSPIATRAAAPWHVAVVSEASLLRAQEHAIVLRTFMLGGTIVLALAALATFFVVTARRTISMRERLRSAEQLVRAEKLATVGVLAAGFAHEVGTPLGVIRGRAEMLVSKLPAETHEARNAATIVEEIDRISRIIRELLDFSRPSRTPAETSARLDAAASNVAELLAFEARKRKVEIRVDVPARLPPLAANLDQLKQVLLNLTMNALQACAPGGEVTLRGDADERARAVIEVVDDGAGIPKDLLHRVFDPFFTTKKRGKGTGLGLTVVTHIVRSHGGEIDLDSAVGRGTRVVVRWPLASTAMEPTDEHPEARAHPGDR